MRGDDEIPAADRGMAALAHLSGLSGYAIPLGGIIVPLIIFLATRRDSVYIARIALQAILLNVATWITLIVCAVGMFVTALGTPVFASGDFTPIGLLLIFALAAGFGIVFIGALALPIVGAVKANRGEYYRYPVVGLSLPDDA